MRTVVVGTAGHIDHGKSALVRALTGTDPDRLKEEQERGITIDLGFAHAAAEGELVLSFVDVPGHERFVRNMLAGAAGIDVVVLVVAADESVMPQTREHLDICRLLGVREGVIALTKCDLADEETRELCRLELGELVAGSFLEDAPVIECSAVSRQGLDDVLRAVRDAADRIPERRGDGPFRMPIDRVFTLRGFGTVVTGTAASGRLGSGAEIELLPSRQRARVRGLQVHGEASESARAGQRVAVNLGGISHDSIVRGEVVVTPGSHVAASMLDVRVQLLPDAPELDDLARVRLHLGTAEAMARVRWAHGAPPEPGGEAFAQLRLESPVVAAVGDAFILRRYSPVLTIGGGRVLQPRPERKLRKSDAQRPRQLEALWAAVRSGRPADVLAEMVAAAGARGVSEVDLAASLGVDPAEVASSLAAGVSSGAVVRVPGTPVTWLGAGELDAAERRALDRLAAFHRDEPLVLGMSKQALAGATGVSSAVFAAMLERAAGAGRLRVERDLVAHGDHRVKLSAEEERAREMLLAAHRGAGLAPPDLPSVVRDTGLDDARGQRIVHLLLAGRELVKLKDGMLIAQSALEALVADMEGWYDRGEPFSVPDFKDRSGVSRKHAIPLLEYLDAQGLTRRTGDGRTWLGPRAQAVDGSRE